MNRCFSIIAPAAGNSRTLPPVARLCGSGYQAARVRVFCGYCTALAAGNSRTLSPVARLCGSGNEAARVRIFCGYYTMVEAEGFADYCAVPRLV